MVIAISIDLKSVILELIRKPAKTSTRIACFCELLSLFATKNTERMTLLEKTATIYLRISG